jgi:integrase
MNPQVFGRLLLYFPKLRCKRKNVQYLTPEEVAALKQTLADESSGLTLRNRAIGILALYTGLRGCDIAALKIASINWEDDLILLEQQKTEVPLELPLSAVVGNAIYDYLNLERPTTDCEYIFVSEHQPKRQLKSKSLSNIFDKIMKSANIRRGLNDRRGLHIFRHRLATELLGNKVSRPVISQILGHISPKSLDVYLSADFKHLKKCSRSIEKFPINREVFSNA